MPFPGLLDLTLPSPEENLALDEALLECLEGGSTGEWLRFWESPEPFVVLGVGGKLSDEVNLEACVREGVSVRRRGSGGGTVVQGPGCLNFALVLSVEMRPELKDIGAGYRAILERTASALLPGKMTWSGTSDLAIDGRKVSGNAQKRSRRAVLHHGTVLYAMDLGLIARCLLDPAKQPEYRQHRPHLTFVRNLDLPREEIQARIARAWDAVPLDSPPGLPPLHRLLEEKYANRAWIERF